MVRVQILLGVREKKEKNSLLARRGCVFGRRSSSPSCSGSWGLARLWRRCYSSRYLESNVLITLEAVMYQTRRNGTAIAVVWGVTGILLGAKLMGADIPWWLVFFLPISSVVTLAAFLIGVAIILVFSKGK